MTHVLAVRLDNDGDVLLAGPAIRALAAQASRVTLLCGPRGRQAAELLPGVDEVLCWRAPWIDPEPDPVDSADVLVLAARLAAMDIDRALIFGSFHQSPLPTALLLRLAHVPWIGAISVDYPGSLLDLRHKVRDDIHEVERNLSLTAAAGFPLSADNRLKIKGTVPFMFGAGYVVVHPGASAPARAWEPERNAALVEALGGARARGRGDRRRRRDGADRARRRAPAGRTSAGGRRWPNWPACWRALTPWSSATPGPAHLAAAVGTPVVSLFAPTVPPVRWRPWARPARAAVRRRAVRRLSRPDLPGRRPSLPEGRDRRATCVDAVERLVPKAVAA